MSLILRSIERMPQTQFSMAYKFRLLPLHRYNVKHSKMRNFTFDAPWRRKVIIDTPLHCLYCHFLWPLGYSHVSRSLHNSHSQDLNKAHSQPLHYLSTSITVFSWPLLEISWPYGQSHGLSKSTLKVAQSINKQYSLYKPSHGSTLQVLQTFVSTIRALLKTLQQSHGLYI
jgi:hypothetical protein